MTKKMGFSGVLLASGLISIAILTAPRPVARQDVGQRPSVLIVSGPIPLIDLADLVRRSDFIAVGRITEISDGGRAASDTLTQCQQCGPLHQFTASLQVDRVLEHGDSHPLAVWIKFLVAESRTGNVESNRIREGIRGMFFLHSVGDGAYGFASSYYPYVVAPPTAPPSMNGGTVYDRAVSEVVHVLDSFDTSPSEKVNAVWALENVNSRSVIQALRQVATNQDVSVRFNSIGSLFRHNDISLLDDFVDTMMNPPQNVPKDLIDGPAASISVGVRDPKAIPALRRLLDSPKAEHRRIAAETLNRTGPAGRDALKKALDDSDQQVRYAAVNGLATITGATDETISLELFQRNEQQYLNHWRERLRKKN